MPPLSQFLCASLCLLIFLFLSLSLSMPFCFRLSPQSLASASTPLESPPASSQLPGQLCLHPCLSAVLAQRAPLPVAAADTCCLGQAPAGWGWHRIWFLVLTIALSALSAVCRHTCGKGFCSRPNLCACADGKLAPSCRVSQGKWGRPLGVGGEGQRCLDASGSPGWFC